MISSNLPENKTIFVVDDDEGVRELITLTLLKEGFRVDSVSTGKEALEKIKANNYDLIILDLMLPGYGGFEILRELQIEGKNNIPVVIITGKYIDRSTQEIIKMEPNVVEFVEKPIKINVFTAIVHKILKTIPKK